MMQVTLKPSINILKCQHISGYNTTFTSDKSEFTGSADYMQYKSADNYAKKLILKYSYVDLDKADLKRLEGIQYGIDVFKGLDVAQIHLLYKYLSAIILRRGCSNECVHCFLDAKPIKLHPDKNVVNSMSWEDFSSLIDGFKTFNERLGHNVYRHSFIQHNIIAPFMDSDSMEIVLKDNSGVEHDMTVIAESFDKIYRKTLFDTSGWTPKFEKMQKRADKYVEFIRNNPHNFNVNISINPFHKLYSKFVENVKNNPERAYKFRNLYVNRMVNTIYTFLPLIEMKEFNFINRAVKDDAKCDVLYQKASHRELIEDIRDKLFIKLRENKHQDIQILKYMELFDEKISYIDTERLVGMGRLKNLFYDKNDLYLSMARSTTKAAQENLYSMFDSDYRGLLIDSNGKVLYFNNRDIIDTDICMNFANKDKITPNLLTITDKKLTTDILIQGLKEQKTNLFSRLLKIVKR